MGSVRSLVDQGLLSNPSGITIRNAVLQWNDAGIQAMSNRLPTNVPLTLDGGAFSYISRGATNGSISLGSLALTGGASEVSVNVGNGNTANAGLGTAAVNFTNLASRSTGATLNFN